MLLAAIFPNIEVDALNVTINTLVTMTGGAYILYRQIATKRATLAGTRPDGFRM